MPSELENLLKECGCKDDYDLCLKYLQTCYPELCITCVMQDDYYLIGKDGLMKMAVECFQKKK